MVRVSFKLATLAFGALLAGASESQGAKVSSPVLSAYHGLAAGL